MKLTSSFLLVILFAASGFAQDHPMATPPAIATAIAPGCGAPKVKFQVKKQRGQHPFAQAEDGKALVYFIEDDSQYHASPVPTMRAGLDGQWVGATHGSSYFYFPVDPGEHHLCTNAAGIFGKVVYEGATRFHAEAGKSYFFRVQNTLIFSNGGKEAIDKSDLQQIEADEGEALASQYPFVTSRPKK